MEKTAKRSIYSDCIVFGIKDKKRFETAQKKNRSTYNGLQFRHLEVINTKKVVSIVKEPEKMLEILERDKNDFMIKTLKFLEYETELDELYSDDMTLDEAEKIVEFDTICTNEPDFYSDDIQELEFILNVKDGYPNV